MKACGLKVDYGSEIDYGESKGIFKTVSDEEHTKIVDSYVGNKSMRMIAQELDRSSATVNNQIREHDKAVERQGYCMRCRRVKGSHDSERVGKAA